MQTIRQMLEACVTDGKMDKYADMKENLMVTKGTRVAHMLNSLETVLESGNSNNTDFVNEGQLIRQDNGENELQNIISLLTNQVKNARKSYENSQQSKVRLNR